MRFPETTSLIVSAVGNLFLVGLFTQALLFPEDNVKFIFNSGMLIFLVEFLSLHSSGMIFSPEARTVQSRKLFLLWKIFTVPIKFILVGVYLLFMLVFGFAFQNWAVPVVFMISLGAKYFGKKTHTHHTSAGISVLLLIGTVFIVTLLAPLWSVLFPFPESVLQQKMSGSSGIWVDIPQTMLVWGILYYGLLGIIEVISFRRQKES
ncbi:hypothetical protein HYX14_02675 [Candidatus Woesearchaeota archaeon]|nr:hypothetical protein [Candidatus Woesearchaeota archaeon]